MSTHNLKIAYILQIHKNPEQVNKFITQILTEKNVDVYLHLDKKYYHELQQKIMKHPKVNILKESINVRWGDISQIDSTLLLLKKVKNSNIKYDFICFRSGQDLLVKNGLTEFLLMNKDKIFMTAYGVKENEPHAAFVNTYWPSMTRKLYSSPFHPNRIIRRVLMSIYGAGWNVLPNRNRLPDSYKLYNGSQWFCIPYEVANYILEFLEENSWYYTAFENSLCPDEFFFQTLIMNSKYQKDVENNNLMFIKFGEALKNRNNPVTLTMEHVETIKKSNNFFARKFDENVDSLVIDYFSDDVRM